jgi:hypothetical protein
MPWSGSGQFSRYYGTSGWANDAAASIFILASRHDTHDQDLATGINACLTRNNEAKPTSSFTPNASNAIDLGSGSASWRQLYLGTNKNAVWSDAAAILGFYGQTTAESTAVVTPTSYFYTPAPFGFANVLRYGADNTGAVNATTAFQNALNANKAVFVPDGAYTLTVGSLSMPIGTEIWLSQGATITVTAGAANYVFNCLGRNKIIGGKFVCTSDYAVVANVLGAINDVLVERVETSGARLLRGNTTGANYAASNAANSPSNIRVLHCIAVSATINTTISCISQDYANDVLIQGNRISGYWHNINWWGGNSSYLNDGIPLTNDRKAKRWRVIGNDCHNATNGGIWGSMGEDITVQGNNVYDFGDTGIDFEGCYNSNATGNTVRCTGAKSCNVLISTFYTCRGVVFAGNTVETAVATVPLYGNYNASNNNTYDYDVTLTGNRFACTEATKVAYVQGNSALHWLKIQGNKFYNACINVNGTAVHNTTITGNDFEFIAVAAAITAIYATAFRDSTTLGAGTVVIDGNKIWSEGALAAGSYGIFAEHIDTNAAAYYFLRNNVIQGPPKDIGIKHSAATAVVPIFYIDDNVLFDATPYERTEAGGANSSARLSNNRDGGGQNYPGSTPVAQRWDVNQVVWFNGPTASNPPGSVCVTAGVPGTWKNMGNLSA